MNLHDAIYERLQQIRRDREVVRKRIRRSDDKQVIRALRKLNNLLEATERSLDGKL